MLSIVPDPNILPLLIVVHVVTFAKNITQMQTAALSKCRQTLLFISQRQFLLLRF